jgi:hypothetical protein
MAKEVLGYGEDDGTALGRSTTDKIAFYGTTPVVQRTSTDLSASIATVASSSSFASGQAAALNAVVLAMNEIRTTLKNLGLHAG